MHRAIWKDGREVAVKLQYPGAEAALRADLDQLFRVAPLIGVIVPGMQIRPLLAELRDRILEELDYAQEADNQRAFAAGYAGDADFLVPRVVASAPKVIVSEWVEGISLGKIIASGTTEQRDRAGTLLTELHFAAPERVGLLHADPHPGNYMLTADGRLAVIDFGSVARLPDGAPPIIGQVTRLALEGRSADVLEALREEGFVLPDYDPDPDLLMNYVVPFIEPLRHETFHFTRSWMQEQAARMSNFSSEESKMARRLNLPPSYLLIHRVTFGSIGVLCQLDATAPFREMVTRYLPGFADPELTGGWVLRHDARAALGLTAWRLPPGLVEFRFDRPHMLPRASVAHPAPTAPRIGLQHPAHRRLGDRRPAERAAHAVGGRFHGRNGRTPTGDPTTAAG